MTLKSLSKHFTLMICTITTTTVLMAHPTTVAEIFCVVVGIVNSAITRPGTKPSRRLGRLSFLLRTREAFGHDT